jgi:mediator of RNA polymerase II transcription subunit 31
VRSAPRRSRAHAHARAAWRLTPATRADLAQHRLLAEPSMVAYLAYLQYWQAPQYARFLAYPASLAMLQLLQAPEFRAAMAAPEATEHVWRQQFYAWQHGGRHLWAAQAPQWAGQPEAPPPEPAPADAAAVMT